MFFQNNNKDSVKKISNASFKANKMRNLFAIIAIILTTTLMTAGFTAGMSFWKTSENYLKMGKGVDAHGSMKVTLDQYEKLKKINKVTQYGLLRDCSTIYIQSEELVGNKVYLKAADKEMFKMNFITPIEGDYPKNSSEIMMPTFILDLFDMAYEVGRKITLNVSVIENGKEVVKPFDFTLSAYYETVVPASANYAELFTGEDFIEKYNPSMPEDSNEASVKLSTLKSNDLEEKAWEEIEKVAAEIGATGCGLDPDFAKEEPLENKIKDVVTIGIPVLVAAMIIMATGYLLIYNIFYISVVNDIKFYGLLKTIGTTPKQIKKIINKQAFKLSLIGIPVGMVLGYLLGVIITPYTMTITIFSKYVIISKSILIFIFSAIFSYLTVYISCRKPSKIAGGISPIEATRYTGVEIKLSKKNMKKGRNGAKLHKMALSNIFRSKTKTIMVLLSISLSAIAFIFVINATTSMDPVEQAKEFIQSDFQITHFNAIWWQEEEYNPLSKEMYEELKGQPFVKDINKYYMARSENDNFGTWLGSKFIAEIKNEGLLKAEVETYREADMPGWEENFIAESGNLMLPVSSVEASIIKEEASYDKIIDGEINEEKFVTGEYIIFTRNRNRDRFNNFYGEGVIKAGDKVKISFLIPESGEYVDREFTVMAIMEETDYQRGHINTITMSNKTFESIYPNYDELIANININIEGDMEEANSKIQSILNRSGNFQIYFSSLKENIKENENLKNSVGIIGSIISLIIGAIGILNMINTMVTSVFTRRKEFAMLQSIGMSKKQLKKMLMLEGLWYSVIALVIIIPIGLGVSLVGKLIPFIGGFNIGIFMVSVMISMAIILGVCLSIPGCTFKVISKDSVIERMREE